MLAAPLAAAALTAWALSVWALAGGQDGYRPALAAMALAAYAVLVWLIDRHCGPLRPGRANLATLARGAAGLATLGAVANPIGWPVVAMLALCLTADGLDGWLARHFAQTSAAGARLDMETDAALILSLSVLVAATPAVGPWVLLSAALRYGFIIWLWLRPDLNRPLPVSLRRRAVCVLQSLSLTICLVPGLPARLAAVVAAMGLLVLVASFAIDVAWLIRQARKERT